MGRHQAEHITLAAAAVAACATTATSVARKSIADGAVVGCRLFGLPQLSYLPAVTMLSHPAHRKPRSLLYGCRRWVVLMWTSSSIIPRSVKPVLLGVPLSATLDTGVPPLRSVVALPPRPSSFFLNAITTRVRGGTERDALGGRHGNGDRAVRQANRRARPPGTVPFSDLLNGRRGTYHRKRVLQNVVAWPYTPCVSSQYRCRRYLLRSDRRCLEGRPLADAPRQWLR